jgi:hypothetical protein
VNKFSVALYNLLLVTIIFDEVYEKPETQFYDKIRIQFKVEMDTLPGKPVKGGNQPVFGGNKLVSSIQKD